jgi:hypothetical protein
MAWLRRAWLPILTHVGALLPLARLIWNFFHDQLTANPIQYITFQTGKSALVLLVLALACTPLNTIFELVRDTQARVHLCRLSSAAGIDLVRRAKTEGLPITCDVGINHVHLTDTDIGYFNAARLWMRGASSEKR